MVNTESPRSFKYSDINSIYDGNGLSLVDRDDYMKFPAIINDSDDFTYVREGPSKKYRVKGKILKNDIFLYTPVLDGDWYRVYSKHVDICKVTLRCVGYLTIKVATLITS